MKILIQSAAALALAVLPLAAQPAAGGPGPGFGAGPGGGRLMRTLNLTGAQKTAIQGIHEKHGVGMAAHREAVRQTQAALQAAWQDPATPEAQLRALHDKASSARFEMRLAQRAVHQEVQAVLTPEQRAKAAELRGEARGRHQERMRHVRGMGHGRGPRGGGQPG